MFANTDSSLMVLDGLITPTSHEQMNVENLVEKEKKKADGNYKLFREMHVNYILRFLNNLPSNCMSMDSSKAWFCFWGIHGLRLLGHQLTKDLAHRMIGFLTACQTKEGGYSGAPGQMPHLATTYASVMALVSLGTEEALNSIDRNSLRNFIASMKNQNGSFSIHKGGEIDVRAAYCAIAVAHICNLTDLDGLFKDTQTWLTRCQTYEGGFGGEPNCEAHGGYTFCSLAALSLLQKIHLINLDAVLQWLINRQMRYEGGFQGRTNKLVDVCYSYWIAACFSSLESQIVNTENGNKNGNCLFNAAELQCFILEICQNTGGGFSDKPNKPPDMYHTCYSLSGLSIAQSRAINKDILGRKTNVLEATHPFYNVTMGSYENAIQFFNPL